MKSRWVFSHSHYHTAIRLWVLVILLFYAVQDLKINARILKIVMDAEKKSAAVEAELFGDAKRSGKPFILANALVFDFDENMKIKYWSDHLDTFTLAKCVPIPRRRCTPLLTLQLLDLRAWKN